MQRFILPTISVAIAMLISITVDAQNQFETYSFDEFSSFFQKEQIKTPISSDELLEIDLSICRQIDCESYNYIVIKSQKERAKRRTIEGRDFHITRYGLVDCKGVMRNGSLFYEKIYVLGCLKNEKYKCLITRIESVMNTFVDLYIFNNEGKFLSFLDLYEDENYEKNGIRNIDSVYIRTEITTDGIIHYEENRYGVNVKIDYQLQDDGILKEVAKSIIGQYEVVDKDGYVNVREKPDAKSKVLYTIESGSVIISHSENGSKWEKVISIEDSDKKGGYIHSSRLRNYW
ncbi:MAG: SH3 domain-containing protein [Bacteroidales bacterium]|jgi:hypothetical protein|nr:SH3 domain-containing protein [Bacteroidales bacterium]